ncbi:lysosome-associated membrane glycoprotein 3 isoform X1 [Monodelphis domestica]|uniref:lysosome-associated membrane glycoprotein 3 isoform X1 n=1 Tax=Monodelphis domestica TaxID=13616 RepID=UPI0024E26B07|nr:lysosome-associated membrane glycoprotein 3 isoform X1 [Monodelphis domestica]
MKKELAMLLMLVFSAVILSCYSGILNKKFGEARGYEDHDKRTSVQVTAETSFIHSTSFATALMGSTDGHAIKSDWPTTQASLKTTFKTTQSTGTSTQSADPTTLTDITTKVSHHSTQMTTTVNTATPAPPGSPTATRTAWSSTPMAQMTTAAQSTVSHTTLATITTPVGNLTSLKTAWITVPAKSITTTSTPKKTTQAITTTATHPVTASTSPATTNVGPTLVPQPSSPQTGTYLVYNGTRVCLKAEMGVQLLIQDKMYFSPQMYFNLHPNVTKASGNCSAQRTNLLLTFPGGFVNLTFVKVGHSYHIETVETSLTVLPLVKVYSGLKGGLKMFETKVGHSFKCVSEQSVELSAQLQLHTVDVQLQAFDFDGDHFGNADECFSDKNRRAIPMAMGLSIAALLAVLLTACLVARKWPSRGYERV